MHAWYTVSLPKCRSNQAALSILSQFRHCPFYVLEQLIAAVIELNDSKYPAVQHRVSSKKNHCAERDMYIYLPSQPS